jgi:hypothetical protein
MSSVERLRFVIVLDLRILDRVDFDGMPSLRAMSAVVFGLVLSVGFGCTVKYGVFWTRDAKAKVLDVVLGLVLVRATVAAAISAAVGETVMSRAPPWESEVGRTPPELRVFGVEPPRGTGCTAPPRGRGIGGVRPRGQRFFVCPDLWMGVDEENVVGAGISAVELFGSGDGDVDEEEDADVDDDVDDEDVDGAAVADAKGAGSAVGGGLVADGMHS